MTALDTQWFDRFAELFTEDYNHLSGDPLHRREQKLLFMQGNIENPDLGYPLLEVFDFDKKEAALKQLLEDIHLHEKHDVVKEVYQWKIEEQLDTVAMLRAAYEQDDSAFFAYSTKIYGAPSNEVYAYTLKRVKQALEELPEYSGTYREESIAHLADNMLHEHLIAQNTIDFESFGIEPPFQDYTGERPLNSQEVRAGLQEALDNLHITSWSVEIDEYGNHKNLSSNQEKKIVYVPNDAHLAIRDKPLTRTRLGGLIAHEIGTHVLRRENGEASALKLLGFGFDRVLKAEEGIATYQEQKYEGARDFTRGIGFIAASLAIGVDGKKRSFREVFDIIKHYIYLGLDTGTEESWKEAKERAWHSCVRTFRGTTCQQSGYCFTKDIVYREGNIAIWHLIKERPEMEQYFLLGKFDPANHRHVGWLQDLGMVPTEDNER